MQARPSSFTTDLKSINAKIKAAPRRSALRRSLRKERLALILRYAKENP